MKLRGFKGQIVLTLVVFAIVFALWLFPYSLVATLWSGNSYDTAWTRYAAEVHDQWVRQAIQIAILIVILRIVNWFERRPKELGYGHREDGYKASARD